ncbi:flavin reductase family protein [Streptomyces sp. Tu 3180]|uniref:flavin reductase family protein n=1 Tax=Streptomyces sp. Tu 3180 TaxID=2682611 RepID=UPI00135872E5|nr:flavin reductase family protein [Streptomyces sp. Tu 3180]KAF3463515.1 flavin reductase family protein [Streptomyces sp. Tu 3180]
MTPLTAEASAASPVPERAGTVAPAEFREAMTRFATCVTVITAQAGSRPVGCTATAVFSLTDRPPTLVMSLASGSGTLRAVREAGAFAVNVLSWRQRPLVDRFARLPAGRRFEQVPYDTVHGAPLLEGAVAGVVCRVSDCVPLDDHVLVSGRVVHARADEDATPLVHFARRPSPLEFPV